MRDSDHLMVPCARCEDWAIKDSYSQHSGRYNALNVDDGEARATLTAILTLCRNCTAAVRTCATCWHCVGDELCGFAPGMTLGRTTSQSCASWVQAEPIELGDIPAPFYDMVVRHALMLQAADPHCREGEGMRVKRWVNRELVLYVLRQPVKR
jgi:hypothetical protein